MTVEEALELIDSVLVQKRLNDVQEKVFRQSWEGSTYPEIGRNLDYSDAYLRRIGTELWQLLSEGFGERVTKSNFQSVIRRHAVGKSNTQDESIPKPVSSVAAASEVAIPPHTPLPATSTDPNFVGREGAIAQLTSLVNQGTKIITICAPGGVGKTTLAWQYLQSHGFEKILEIWMAKEIQNINSVESEVERWLQQDFGEEPGRDFGVNLERLRQKLRDPNQRIGILIDNLEPALDKNGRFIESRRAYVDFLRVLADPGVRSLTLITSRERLCEPSIEIKDYCLEGLDETSWQEFFSSHGVQINSPVLTEMHRACGGNAKAMQILSSTIQIDFNRDPEYFWQQNQADLLLNPTLENLVSEQFNRLQTIYPEAYQLLCRLGCYRYQDIPTVPLAGLSCLLWEIEEPQRNRVVKSLKNRALIEVSGYEYWLHPIIRAEAIRRIKSTNDWKEANRRAARFWTDGVEVIETLRHALQAFEPYHHYINIDEFRLAGSVIAKHRRNKWDRGEPLGRSFYRLGLLQELKIAIETIISSLEESYLLSRLYNILGDLYWLTGELKIAITFHEKSGRIAANVLETYQEYEQDYFWLQRMKTFSLFNIGLCKIDLWQLEEALCLFEKVKSTGEKDGFRKSGFHNDDDCADLWCYISFLKSQLSKNRSEIFDFADTAYCKLSTARLDTWAQGYSLIYLGLTYKNLKKLNKAFELYYKAIKYSEESYYVQVKAKALLGLAELHRQEINFEIASLNHLESIEILNRIGAKCDLAEAYFQFGLTYEAMGEVEKWLEYRDRAIQLFEEMEAPRQVERVRQAFASSDS